MAYASIPRVGAGYIDGAFRGGVASTQPWILILGTAKKGLSYELFSVFDVASAEKTFGKESEMMRAMHEAIGQGADNISLMRVGGQAGKVVITATTGETLTVTTGYYDDQILDRYTIIIQASSIEASLPRVLVYDLVDLQYVYDSDNIEALDTGIIDIDGVLDWPVGAVTLDSAGAVFSTSSFTPGTLPVNALRLGTVAAADLSGVEFNAIKSAALGLVTSSDFSFVSTVTKTAGTDGMSMSAVQRYACLEFAYQILDFRDADIVVPCGIYHDTPNIATDTEDDVSTAQAVITVTGTGAAAPQTLVLTDSSGTGVTFTCDAASASTSTLIGLGGTSTAEDIAQRILDAIVLDGTFTATRSGAVVYVTSDAAGATGNQTNSGTMADVTKGNFVGGDDTADKWDGLAASSGSDSTGITAGCTVKVAPTYKGSASLLLPLSGMRADSEEDFLGYVWQYRYKGKIFTFFTDGTDITSASTNVIGPNELTGEEVPAAVYARFNSATAAEIRECNFSHQLASFCYRASTNWSQMIGLISTEVPDGFSRTKLRDHAGELPDYTFKGGFRVIDASADNGEGLLGDKFLAGAFGYRNAAIDAADKDATDGYGRGGFILTTGASLPNQEPYGVDDTDEAVDRNDRPIDIGKHIVVSYDWPLMRSGFNGGSAPYCNSLVGPLAGRLATLEDNLEPIGTNGTLANIVGVRRFNISHINDLAFVRLCGLRRDDGVGHVIVSCKTAAHPTSDYSRLSTIRCVNRILSGIRERAKGYIGSPFSSSGLLSLQQAIDGYLAEQRAGGYHQGAVATLSYSRADRIIGKLTIQLKMIPPFSIETIIVETSLAAEETEL